MKQIVLLTIQVMVMGNLCAQQKPVIDSTVYGKWPSTWMADISNNGRYVDYAIDNEPPGSHTTVVTDREGSWKMSFPGIAGGAFTPDSRSIILMEPHDSLGILTLGTSSIEWKTNVGSFGLSKRGENEWLAYLLDTPDKELIVRDLKTGKEQSFTHVGGFSFNDEGTALLLKTESGKDTTITQSLDWVNLPDGNRQTIWEGMNAGKPFFDHGGTQLAFTVEDKTDGIPVTGIWYYKSGSEKAVLLTDSRSISMNCKAEFDNISEFSKDDQRILFSLKRSEELPRAKPGAAQVDVWSYMDTQIQSEQLGELEENAHGGVLVHSYQGVLNIGDHRVVCLNQDKEWVTATGGDYALIEHLGGEETSWNRNCKSTIYLESLKDGSRKLITNAIAVQLSPEGKYLVYYDPKQKICFSYETATGVTRNITGSIHTDWTLYGNDHPDAGYAIDNFSGWLKGGGSALLHDRNDIWQVDLSGNKPPVNVTNGYGFRHNIQFSLAMDNGGAPIAPGARLILNAFNRGTKDNGFYAKALGATGDPELLTMGPYVYQVTDAGGRPPQKAQNAEVYLVMRQTASDAPNWFATTDFKTMTRLSDIHPEKAYNWLTSELVTWKTLDGGSSQGILYKPENFDPRKKYPVIFYFYEQLSYKLHEFLVPDYNSCEVDIPTFVSNGYLVFTPDIHYKMGKIGESAVNSLVSAAQYLSRLPFVDGKHMAIQGESFGGYETDYLVANSHVFAAAMCSEGVADCISDYGALWGGGSSKEGWAETGQGRMGATLWERPEYYIKNSPLFNADRVTTPLLIMDNKKDPAVPYPQGIEFFTALRRLGKKVWLLQYDKGVHWLETPADKADFTIRVSQFFDHYLRGAPAPKWMVEGIPARLKGVDAGLELEPDTAEPGPGLLVHAANEINK